MTESLLIAVVDEGLGNSSYLVDLGHGRALAVDAGRDLRALRAAARARGLTVAYAADTHLHADFLSGACQLAAEDGARILASAAGHREFEHTGLQDGDEVDLGGIRLRALATAGHTDEHLAFLLLDDAKPLGVFTGGSLLVGSAARTDLVAPDRTEALARAQYASLQRLLTLPDATAVWPTHGAGSFCSAPPGADRTSSIGQERASNPLLQAHDEDAFVRQLLASLGSYPPYFAELGQINRRGPEPLPGAPPLSSLPVDAVARLLAAGTPVVDVRPIEQYAAAHLPGSLSIELRDVFATWLGWLVPFGAAPVIVRGPEQDPEEFCWQAAKIGYDLAGELTGGVAAWQAAGHPTSATRLTRAEELRDEQVLDIRQSSEYATAHIPGAGNVELGAIASRIQELRAGPLVVMCGHGERAMSAASVLEQHGRAGTAVLLGGPGDWAREHDTALATGH